ncbi:MAG: hypothetical protein GXO82_10420 [Chlorobi bacterium]|nr:hypothetical protein [Chlorobiota bacterium]
MKKAYRLAMITSASLLFSMVFYVIIVEIIALQEKSILGERALMVGIIRWLFIALVASISIGIRYIRSSMLRFDSSLSVGKRIGKLFKTTIMVTALCEVPAILGMVLFFIGGNRWDFYPFLFFSALLIVLYFPRFDYWQENASSHSSSP